MVFRRDCSLDCSDCLLNRVCYSFWSDEFMGEEMVHVYEKTDKADVKVEYPSVKLSQLIKGVISVKKIIVCPTNYRKEKEELYNTLDYLEHELLTLKDSDVELKRDW